MKREGRMKGEWEKVGETDSTSDQSFMNPSLVVGETSLFLDLNFPLEDLKIIFLLIL